MCSDKELWRDPSQPISAGQYNEAILNRTVVAWNSFRENKEFLK
jgi:hypothetical protein